MYPQHFFLSLLGYKRYENRSIGNYSARPTAAVMCFSNPEIQAFFRSHFLYHMVCPASLQNIQFLCCPRLPFLAHVPVL